MLVAIRLISPRLERTFSNMIPRSTPNEPMPTTGHRPSHGRRGGINRGQRTDCAATNAGWRLRITKIPHRNQARADWTRTFVALPFNGKQYMLC